MKAELHGVREKEMQGIHSSGVGADTLVEAAFACRESERIKAGASAGRFLTGAEDAPTGGGVRKAVCGFKAGGPERAVPCPLQPLYPLICRRTRCTKRYT